ncbi:helix-turn-helix domain-containing protein [Streptomyces lasiicapitis]|uniref:DNA-binding protein n=1 Tax=Streptomyces lasiicapitis TaxID=1923961 RepID=A0ABQ2M663_9ACTN|nr:helix-turn-helix domain-containing protein [Streptomyces lasiicapitis]GGO47443.1 DNA-binding protein [Streptomyces lasiicapitis]
MTSLQPSAPTRARSGRSGPGVDHVTERHHDRFTVVGNHLAQHSELSLMAIGLATHIQSLPAGSPIGIKSLALRFPEGEMRIAAALRELEAHGYLARVKERLPSGRIVTRTVSYNKPQLAARPVAKPMSPKPVAPKPPEPPPGDPIAVDLLAGLRAHDARLLLTQHDVRRLAPDVSRWLERGVPPAAVRQALTSGLPQAPIRHPAAFLAHRLTEHLPPPLPTTPLRADGRPDPLQTCDGCERAFRAPRPGRCRDCRVVPRLGQDAAA